MDNKNTDNNGNEGWIGKRANVLILIILILSASVYYVYANALSMGLTKPTLVATVSTGTSGEGLPIITNVTFKQSSVIFFYKTSDVAPNFPEIDANARINTLNAVSASYWASVPYSGDNTYTLTLYFKPGNIPKKDDLLIIPLRVVDLIGTISYKTTAFWTWE